MDCKDCLPIKQLKEEVKEIKEDIEVIEKALNKYITKTEIQQVIISNFEENFKKIEKIAYSILATVLFSYFKDFIQLIK
jgi:hypothetical protein